MPRTLNSPIGIGEILVDVVCRCDLYCGGQRERS